MIKKLYIIIIFILTISTNAEAENIIKPDTELTIKGIQYIVNGENFDEFIRDFEEIFSGCGLKEAENILLKLKTPHIKQNIKLGEEILLKNAEEGENYAQLFLCYYYFRKANEDIIYKDDYIDKSLFWLEKAYKSQNPIGKTLYALAAIGNNIGVITINNNYRMPTDDALKLLKELYYKDFYFSNYLLAKIYLDDKAIPHNYSLALEILTHTAKKGYPLAQKELADIYYDGKYTSKDAEMALAWYNKLAEIGDYQASIKSADIYLEKLDYANYAKRCNEMINRGKFNFLTIEAKYRELEKEDSIYAKYFISIFENASKSSIDFAKQDSLYLLGEIYLNGKIVDKDINKGIKYLVASANIDSFDRAAKSKLGHLYFSGELVPKNNKEAIKWLLKSDNWSGTENAILANLYLTGEFIVKSDQKEKWNKIAKEESDILYNKFSRLYYGEKKSIFEALPFLEQSAELNNIESCLLLGYLYSSDIPFLNSQPLAFKWYNKAHVLGSAEATYEIASRYYNGKGISRDYKKAFEYATKSALLGNANSMSLLAELLYFGTGTDKDIIKAYAWHNIAASKGNEDSAIMRDNIEKELPKAQIEEAQQLSIILSGKISDSNL